MEIEVKQPEGFYLKAYVSDITDDGLDVVYERNWRKPERVKFEQCRAVLTDGGINKQNFKAGDIVDAFVRIDKTDKEEMHGWNKMKIRDIKNDFAVVDSAEGSLSISDIVPVSQCRHPALASQISSAHVKSCTIPLGDDHLFEYFAKDGETYKVLQESVPAICIKLDETNKELVIKAFSAATIKKVEILKEAFLSNSRQKMLILQRQEENKKMLSLHEPQHEAVFCMEFDVSTAYMGLAIGSQGANISNARKLEGVQEVVLDESKREDGYCKFKIYAQNAEAAQQARNMLEFLQKQKFVPQSKVGQVIGKQGKTIQDIVDKSGVVRVQIGDENPEQGMVPLTFTGTCEAISNAELMVDFHLKHITAMDEIRAEDEEIKRKLYLSRNSPFQHYNNSSNNGQQYNSSYRQQNNNNQRTQNGGGDGRGGRGQYQPQQDGQVRGDGYRGRPNGGRGGGRFNQQDGGRVAGRGGGRFYGGGGQRGGYGGPPRGGPGRPRYGAGGGGGGPGPKQQRDQREDQQERVQSPNTQQGSEDERDENGSSSYNGTTSIHTEQQSSPTTSNKPSQQNAHKQGQATGGFGGGSTRAGGGNRNQQQRNVPQRNRRSQADEE